MGSKIQQLEAGAPPRVPFKVADVTNRMVNADEMAYRVFYDEYYERLRRYLLVVTAGNEETTREALQTALLRVVKHIRRFETECELWGWLTVLARTALFDQNRKRKRYWSFLERFTSHTEIEQAGELEVDSDGKLLAILEEKLATLPLEERQLLESKYIDGDSVRDIAEHFQTSEKAIESRLSRIRAKLKSTLLEKLKDESLS